MPDDTLRPSERRTGPFRDTAERLNREIAATGVEPPRMQAESAHLYGLSQIPGVVSGQPVTYAPTVSYRGRVLWHHLSDAHTVATRLAARHGHRQTVKPVRVSGWRHVLWQVKPTKTPFSPD
jgi:hypothetical protein